MNVNVKDSHSIEAFFQNIWTRSDIGGESLIKMSDGIESDKTFKIPPSVFPRFTVIEKRARDQAPVEVEIISTRFLISSITDNGITLTVNYKLRATIKTEDEIAYGFDPESLHIVISGVPYLGTYTKVNNVITLDTTFSKVFPSNLTESIRNLVSPIPVVPRNTLKTVTVVDNGAGYFVDDTVTIPGGVYTSRTAESPAIFKVSLISDEYGITGVTIENIGDYVELPQLDSPMAIDDIIHEGDTFYDQNPYEYEKYDLDSYGSGASFNLTWDQIQRTFMGTLVNLDLAHIELYFSDINLKMFYLLTGRYSTPYHQGSKVEVNGESSHFGNDYVVDETRGFIQFLAGRHPVADANDVISIMIFRSDKLFISYHEPFRVGDTFTIEIDSSLASKSIVTYFDSVSENENKANLNVTNIDLTKTNNGDIYHVVAVGDWKFSVQRVYPTTGNISYASFKTPYTNGAISFTIDRHWRNYHLTDSSGYFSYLIEQDGNSYYSFDIAADIKNSRDLSEFFSDLSITTEHGVVGYSSLHHPVNYQPLGVIKKVRSTTSIVPEQDDYIFVLNNIPPKNTYIELRVEQTNQLNPTIRVSIQEQLIITSVEPADKHGNATIRIINSSNPTQIDTVLYSDYHPPA
jgi:hypothetical protein